MTNQSLGLILGGLLPALFFGLSGVFAKPATAAGIGLGLYVMIVGLAIAVVGALVYCIQPDHTFTFRGAFFATLVGLAWAIGAALVALALDRYGVALSRIVPLYNLNTLVAVLIGLVVFSEWRDVEAPRLIFGALLIFAGGTLVATS